MDVCNNVVKKKENINSNIYEASKDNDEDEKCEDKTELEIEVSKFIEETKRKKKNENKINKSDKDDTNNVENTHVRIKFNTKDRR